MIEKVYRSLLLSFNADQFRRKIRAVIRYSQSKTKSIK